MNKRFTLETYVSGGRNRYTCPHCGRKKCFTRYIDTWSNRPVAEECGRCDHESSCGYHYPPSSYFADHPEQCADASTSVSSLIRSFLPITTGPSTYVQSPRQTTFFPSDWPEQSLRTEALLMAESPFHRWFLSLPYSPALLRRVLAEYRVGATAYPILSRGVNYGRAVIFWQMDEQQRVHDAKLMIYRADGHRIAGWTDWIRALCCRKKIDPQLERSDKVLFGLHLAPKYPDKEIYIVESEKSALVGACHWPQYLWLATGGCGNLSKEKLRPLRSRKLVICPDSGALEKWRVIMKQSGHLDYRFVSSLEEYLPNTDIADLFLGEAVKRHIN